MHKKWLVLSTILMVMALTSGCAQYLVKITEHQDGTALFEYHLSVNPLVLNLISPQGVNPLDDWQQMALAQGFTVQKRQQDNWVTYTAQKNVQSLTEIPPLASLLTNTTDTKQPFKLEQGAFISALELKEGIDLSQFWGIPDSAEAQLAKTLLEDIKIQFSYSTPRHVLQHNADVVQHDENNNTLLWNIVPGKNNKILLTTKNLITRHLAGGGALLAIMAYYVLMVFRLHSIGVAQPQMVPINCRASANASS